MKKITIFLLILAAFGAEAQHKSHKTADTLTPLKPLKIDLDKLNREMDSTNKITDSLVNASTKRMMDEDVKRMTENNNRNRDAFVAMQKERERKQMQFVWIRLGFGVLLLGFFIIRWAQRRKKKKEGSN
jgi:hypothetical protein